MWVFVFLGIGLLGLAVVGLLGWRIVRKTGALLAAVGDVADGLSAIGETAAGLGSGADPEEQTDSRRTGVTNPDRVSAT